MTLEYLEIMEDVNRLNKRNKMMTVSETLLKALKGFEGLSLTAYEDAAGILTIGYGHTGKDVRAGDRISEYWATELLRQDVRTAEQAVNKLEVARTQGQFDALVSFVYNLGIGRFSYQNLYLTELN